MSRRNRSQKQTTTQRPLLRQRSSTRHQRESSGPAQSDAKRLPVKAETECPAIVRSAAGCARSSNRLPRIHRRQLCQLGPGNVTRRILRNLRVRKRGLVDRFSLFDCFLSSFVVRVPFLSALIVCSCWRCYGCCVPGCGVVFSMRGHEDFHTEVSFFHQEWFIGTVIPWDMVH